MAPRYPHGKWHPLGLQTQPRMRSHDIICVHTMVGSLYGTDAYFKNNGYGGTESHFGVGHDGETFQWQDLDYSADANYHGNDHVISIETADIGPGFPEWNTRDGSQVPAWTKEQVNRLADLTAWLCYTYDIPLQIIPNSRNGNRGVGYHRQGVPGYMVPDGEQWSLARGKVCPGNRRIAQIPEVVAKARQILGSPSPRPKEEDMGIQVLPFNPSPHIQVMRFPYPVGGTSITAHAWISGTVNGPDKGSVRVWAQSDTGGIADWWLNLDYNKETNVARRDWKFIPDGTTQLNLHCFFPQGGAITLESQGR